MVYECLQDRTYKSHERATEVPYLDTKGEHRY